MFPSILLAVQHTACHVWTAPLVTCTSQQPAALLQEQAQGEGIVTLGLSKAAGTALLVAWAAILIAVLVLQATTSYKQHLLQPAHWFATFYWIGSAIYGGGTVVLPMLMQEVVQYGCWVDDRGHRVRQSIESGFGLSASPDLLSSGCACT